MLKHKTSEWAAKLIPVRQSLLRFGSIYAERNGNQPVQVFQKM